MLDLSQAFASALWQIVTLDPQLFQIIALSLKVTLTAVAIATLLGFAIGGVLAVYRMTLAPLRMSIGGEEKTVVIEGEPKYSAVYELESAEVLTSPAWAAPKPAEPTFEKPYVLPWTLVILCTALGLITICRPGKRADKARVKVEE